MAATILFDAPGPRERNRYLVWTLIGLVPVLIAVGVGIAALAEDGTFDPDAWAVLADPDLLTSLGNGVLATLQVALVTVALSIVAGLLLAIARISMHRWVSVSARVWIETLRGLPELLLIFFIYLGVPVVTGYPVSTFWALVTGLVLYESAAMAEVFRSGFVALPRGQREAAEALGMRRFKTLTLIELPQVVRQVLPSMLSEMVRATKASSLGFVIGFTDLLRNGELAIAYLGSDYAVPVFAAVAALYVALCLLLTALSHAVSNRLHSGRRQKTPPPTAVSEALPHPEQAR